MPAFKCVRFSRGALRSITGVYVVGWWSQPREGFLLLLSHLIKPPGIDRGELGVESSASPLSLLSWHLLLPILLPPSLLYRSFAPAYEKSANKKLHYPELVQTHVHRVGDGIQSSHPLSSPFLPALIFPSNRVFSNESVLCIRWPKYWSFSFSISPSNEYSGLISFRIDLLDLLAVQGTLKSLLQHHSSKASVLWHSAFFIVQLSHPYMITGNHSFD